jgi:predicted DCC family thiol-disulfide oxidoreductase YuxK
MRGRTLLFYDADCGLCTFFRNVILRLDLRRRIVSIPIGSREADPYLGDLGDERRWVSMHVVGPDGTRTSAGPALLELIRVLPLLRGVAGVLEARDRGVRLADRVYEFTVRLREGLAG